MSEANNIVSLIPISADMYAVHGNAARDLPAETGIDAEETLPELGKDALYGPLGEVVNKLKPHTEGHPAALLFQALTAVGNMLGRDTYTYGGNSRQNPNLFTALVAPTGEAKGSSWAALKPNLSEVDAEWAEERISLLSLSTGQGLVYALEGELDRRILVVDEEMASIFAAMRRKENNLSMIMRRAWDGDTIGNLTKNDPVKVEDAHVSIIGHITTDELRSYILQSPEMANGWANRILWVPVRRVGLLPFGCDTSKLDLKSEANAIKKSLSEARNFAFRTIDEKDGARDFWEEYYKEDREATRRGISANMSARVLPNTLRIALIFSAIDGAPSLGLNHLQAAKACMDYVKASVSLIFDSGGSHSENAIKLLNALRKAPMEQLTMTSVSEVFSKNLRRIELDAVVGELVDAEVAEITSLASSRPGRPRTILKLKPKGRDSAG